MQTNDLLHFRQILKYFFFSLVLSSEASFLPNMSVYLLKPVILEHNTVRIPIRHDNVIDLIMKMTGRIMLILDNVSVSS